jgi:hypothetical protein
MHAHGVVLAQLASVRKAKCDLQACLLALAPTGNTVTTTTTTLTDSSHDGGADLGSGLVRCSRQRDPQHPLLRLCTPLP